MKLTLFIYRFTQSFRHLLILSGFGTISYCKHTPTCSQYYLKTIQTEGCIKGLVKGTWRLLRCW
ncbi:MAG: membrane protein insertion efficiency factor YidD [Candidatus Pacebacteria bacterium CG_4_10_14_0_8_um_filter_43_12]|nr:MAG: membrane protein insertion efficiency factor YidD [Candidatus Pacebacteria bacterium CG10_big_fil_rev_8_21_14_0_10_44_11]PIY79458.1 MAG: membrane protein insertion efficiency factor YidD [Candidatus Pacebacteria bacterium CG_4_10_14_0_8_um_filter_43_12]